jgi:thymidylate synthase (FAD)
MRIIKPVVIVEDDLEMLLPNGMTLAQHMLKKIEMFSRKCYKSEGRMTDDSYLTFPGRLFNTNRHTGIAEHRMISSTFITDRGVSHEGVRHRMAAYLQESTRYVDYAKEGELNKGASYILPPWVNEYSSDNNDDWAEFVSDTRADDSRYAKWRTRGWTPEKARYWLPQGVKTEYAASLNLGSWWNFFYKRTPETAHPSMRQVAIPLHQYFVKHLPQFFEKLTNYVVVDDRFLHKGQWYPMAKLVVNPYYDQVEFEEVYSE